MQRKRSLDALRISLRQIAAMHAKKKQIEKVAAFDHEAYRQQYADALQTVGREEMLNRTMEWANKQKGGQVT